MATTDVDLAQLKIDRTRQKAGPAGRRFPFRKLLFWAVVLVIIGGGALVAKDALNPGVEVQLATASLTSPAQANSVLTASGYVVARRKAAVASKGTGTLVYLGVEEGDKVKQGQVVARLDDSDVAASLQKSRENLRVVEADLNDAKKSLERLTLLLKEQVVAQAEYDTAEARYQRVVASINAARFAVQENEVAVQNMRIIAPFDGTVLKKNADVGEIVAPMAGAASSKAAVVTIADMSSLEVEADVSEANVNRVFPEQSCEVRLDAYPDRSYMAYVGKIVPTADRAKATVLVKIRFKNYDQRVLPDMSAKISFLSKDTALSAESAQPFVAVPLSALALRDGREVVYKIKDTHAVQTPVVIGRKAANLVEIKQGLQNGDKVIAKVDENIRDGAKVYLTSQ